MPQTKILARPAATSVSGVLNAARLTVTAWASRRHERAMLARLDDHLLRDIGLDPQAAAEECQKPAWRA